MILTHEEVEHIAALARLEMQADELDRYRRQLSDILAYAARLQAVDLEPQPQPESTMPGSNLRPDETRPALGRADLFRNAAATEAGQFRVPPVLDTND